MKAIFGSAVTTLAVLGIASNAVQADHHMQAMSFAPVELFACTFNEGKDNDDLKELSKRFNKWLSKNDPGYAYWVLSPRFRAEDSKMDFAWIGSWADGAAMGSSYDNWMKDDGGVGPMFAEVMDCAYSLASATAIHAPEGEWPKSSVVWFSRCEQEDDVSLMEAVSAHRSSTAAMQEMGAAQSASWVFLPALGFSDIEFDYYHVQSWPSYAALGSGFDAYFNRGGWKSQAEALADKVECSSPNLYDSSLMHAPE